MTRRPLSEPHVTGHWGVGIVVSIAAEVLVFSNFNLSDSGTGGHDLAPSWRDGHDRQCRTTGGLPYAYEKPNRPAGIPARP